MRTTWQEWAGINDPRSDVGRVLVHASRAVRLQRMKVVVTQFGISGPARRKRRAPERGSMPRGIPSIAHALRLPEPRSEFIMHASNAAAHFGIRSNVLRVPSPLNGERVAAGRMRGGKTRGFDFGEERQSGSLASPLLTLTLPPLRGKGTGYWRPRSIRRLRSRSSRLGVLLEFGVWNLFGVWDLGFGAFTRNSFSHSTRSSRKITEPF